MPAAAPAPPGTIRVLIIDGREPFPSTLFPAWRGSCAVHLAAHAADRKAGLELCPALQPDVIAVDCEMLGEKAPYLTELLRTAAPQARVLAILRPPLMQSQIRWALEKGVDGFIPATASSAEWITAANGVHTTGLHVPPALERAIRQTLGRDPRWTQKLLLSNREREVLDAVANGASSKEIAATLGLSVHTVVNHRRRIRFRLACQTGDNPRPFRAHAAGTPSAPTSARAAIQPAPPAG